MRGALALALALRRQHPQRALVLPAASAREAALARGLDVRTADHLLDVVRAMAAGDAPTELPCAEPLELSASASPPDLRDVKGQSAAKRALEYGFGNVSWYPGGSDGWAKAGLPLEAAVPRL